MTAPELMEWVAEEQLRAAERAAASLAETVEYELTKARGE